MRTVGDKLYGSGQRLFTCPTGNCWKYFWNLNAVCLCGSAKLVITPAGQQYLDDSWELIKQGKSHQELCGGTETRIRKIMEPTH